MLTHNRSEKGAEIDLILQKGNHQMACEFKASSAPKVTRGFHQAVKDLGINKAFVVAPLPDEMSYRLKDGNTATTVGRFTSTTDV